MPSLLEEVRRFCSAHRLRLNTDLGQHFLIDQGILDRIVETACIEPGEHVVEIGPGIGVLTRELLRKGAHVTAIELDERMIPLLQEFAAGNEKTNKRNNELTIVRANALHTEMPTTPYKVVANIPYHITSPLLRHLFLETNQSTSPFITKQKKQTKHNNIQQTEGPRATGGEGGGAAFPRIPQNERESTSRLRMLGGADEEIRRRAEGHWRAGVLAPPLSPDKGGNNYPTTLTLLIQREVAEKICDKIDAGLLTILVGLFGTPKLVATVPPESFLPPPKVDSAVLHIACFREPLAEPSVIDRIFTLTKRAFGQKRKMLRNTLGAFHGGAERLAALHIEQTRRPQTLSVEEWIALARAWPQDEEE